MHPTFAERIATQAARLTELLDAPAAMYKAWPDIETGTLKKSAGVYHFFKMADGRLESVYVGKAGFGKTDAWSLYSRLNQHFQPSQKYALLGKASRALEISPEEAKSRFILENLQFQWLALCDSTKRMEITDNLTRELMWLESFAISILRPKFTDA